MAHPPALQRRPGRQELGDEMIDEVLPPPHEPLEMSPDYVHFDIDATNSEYPGRWPLAALVAIEMLQRLTIGQSWWASWEAATVMTRCRL